MKSLETKFLSSIVLGKFIVSRHAFFTNTPPKHDISVNIQRNEK